MKVAFDPPISISPIYFLNSAPRKDVRSFSGLFSKSQKAGVRNQRFVKRQATEQVSIEALSQYTCEACGLELQKKRTFPDPQGN